MNKLEDYLSQKDAQVRVFALTVLGIALNSILALPAYEAINQFMQLTIIPERQPVFVFLALNVILVPIYCWATSLAFHPKRLVNPLFIQLASAGVVTLLLAVANIHTFSSTPPFLNFLGGVIATFLIAVISFGVFGFLQLILVRRLVGLTGTINDMDRKTFLIDASFQTISDILLSDSFLGGFNLEHRKLGKSKNMLEVYLPYSYSWQIRLLLTPAPNNPKKSILATIAFEKKFYTILKSKCVSDNRDDMIRRIESTIGKKLELTDFDNEASHFAVSRALSITQPKAIISGTTLGEVPTFYRNILILMGIITAVVVGLFAFGLIDFELFATSIIMIVVASAIELGPRLKEIIDSQKDS